MTDVWRMHLPRIPGAKDVVSLLRIAFFCCVLSAGTSHRFSARLFSCMLYFMHPSECLLVIRWLRHWWRIVVGLHV